MKSHYESPGCGLRRDPGLTSCGPDGRIIGKIYKLVKSHFGLESICKIQTDPLPIELLMIELDHRIFLECRFAEYECEWEAGVGKCD